MEENGLIDEIFSAIPEEETNFIMDSCVESAEAIYKYSNSAYGLLENIIAQKESLNLNLDEFIRTIQDPATRETIKALVTQLN